MSIEWIATKVLLPPLEEHVLTFSPWLDARQDGGHVESNWLREWDGDEYRKLGELYWASGHSMSAISHWTKMVELPANAPK